MPAYPFSRVSSAERDGAESVVVEKAQRVLLGPGGVPGGVSCGCASCASVCSPGAEERLESGV